MLISSLERWARKIPLVRTCYTNHYGHIRDCFYRVNQRFHLVNTPIYVHWLSTFDCNFHCKHCEANAGEKKVELLTTEEISRAIRDMGDLGVRTLIITGGEPLLREDIFEIIAFARGQGLQKVYLATNGYLVEKYRRPLTTAGLARVQISIDGAEATNDTFRGVKGAYRRALEALDFFREIGVEERVVSTIVHQENIHELEDLKNTFSNSPATLWNIQLAVPVGRARNMPSLYLGAHQFRDLSEFIRKARGTFNVQVDDPAGYLGIWDGKIRSQPFFCGAGLETCSIMPDGEVLGCHIVYDNSYSGGNIKTTSFKSICKSKNGRFSNPEMGDDCRECKHLHACRGGCWGMRLGNRHCLRETWQNLFT